jgi:hypothetical protein
VEVRIPARVLVPALVPVLVVVLRHIVMLVLGIQMWYILHLQFDK